jgi:ribosomal protein S17
MNPKGKTFTGTVISDKMANTITIKLEYKYRHPKYKKILTKHKKIYSENNKVGSSLFFIFPKKYEQKSNKNKD